MTIKTSSAPETRFLTIEGGRLAYDDTGGDGPAVLAMPGMGELSRVLNPQSTRLNIKQNLQSRKFPRAHRHHRHAKSSGPWAWRTVTFLICRRVTSLYSATSKDRRIYLMESHDGISKANLWVILDFNFDGGIFSWGPSPSCARRPTPGMEKLRRTQILLQ